MADGSYAFGDSVLAAGRLELLAQVFSETTTEFLERLPRSAGRLVVDLGCGPGFTTELLRDVLAPGRLIAVDSSVAFLRGAAERLAASAEVLLADVTDLPAYIGGAELIFARFLLTHLVEPAAAIVHWLSRLAPSGLVAVEEVQSITTEEPILAAYLDLQRQMLQDNHNLLEIGPVIEDVARVHGGSHKSEVVTLTPPTPVVARMFAMNFENWRERAKVIGLAADDELNRIAAGLAELSHTQALSSPITWQLLQLQVQRRQPHRV
jgi:ubiquinone/menaquinone biosynthesis C-methylase UbiE